MNDKDRTHLHIFVNRRKFEKGDGVKPIMTGAEIAELIKIQPDNAVIRLEADDKTVEIGINQKVEIKGDLHFLVTRKTVEGGHEPTTH